MSRVYGYPCLWGMQASGALGYISGRCSACAAQMLPSAGRSGRGSSTLSAPVPSSLEARGAFESRENTKNLKENPVRLSIPFLQLTM